MGRALQLSYAQTRANGMRFAHDEPAIRDMLARFIIDAAKKGVSEEDALTRLALEQFATSKNGHEVETPGVSEAPSPGRSG
jgi:hypothetical protein